MNEYYDDEMEKLLKARHKLLFDNNTGRIEKREYEKKLKYYDDVIDKRCSVILDNIRKNVPVATGKHKIKNSEGKKMDETKTKKPRENSNAQLILKALQQEQVKSIDDAVKFVIAQKPEQVEKNVKAQTKNIIALIQKQHKRFSKYTWDEANFKVIPQAE